MTQYKYSCVFNFFSKYGNIEYCYHEEHHPDILEQVFYIKKGVPILCLKLCTLIYRNKHFYFTLL